MANLLKNYLPRSLFGRAVLIIVTPLVLLQIVSAYVFYRSHWETVSDRLARGLAGDVAALVDLMSESHTDEERHSVIALGSSAFALDVRFRDGEILANAAGRASSSVDDDFLRFLSEIVSRPFKVDADTPERHIVV